MDVAVGNVLRKLVKLRCTLGFQPFLRHAVEQSFNILGGSVVARAPVVVVAFQLAAVGR